MEAVRKVPGATGEIRVVKPGDRLRLTWQADGWKAPATARARPSTGVTAALTG